MKRNNLKFLSLLIISLFLINSGIAQTKSSSNKKINTIVTKTNGIIAKKGTMTEAEIQNWPHMDIFTDSVPGMSIQKAYQFLADKKGEKIIVAIIDSGIDIEHEDLKDVIWSNPKEIPNNNIDDDKNGYVDDMHGWNFFRK